MEHGEQFTPVEGETEGDAFWRRHVDSKRPRPAPTVGGAQTELFDDSSAADDREQWETKRHQTLMSKVVHGTFKSHHREFVSHLLRDVARYNVPSHVFDHVDLIRGFYPSEDPGSQYTAPASYTTRHKMLTINGDQLGKISYKDLSPERRTSLQGTILHELGHALHFSQPIRRSNTFEYTGDPYDEEDDAQLLAIPHESTTTLLSSYDIAGTSPHQPGGRSHVRVYPEGTQDEGHPYEGGDHYLDIPAYGQGEMGHGEGVADGYAQQWMLSTEPSEHTDYAGSNYTRSLGSSADAPIYGKFNRYPGGVGGYWRGRLAASQATEGHVPIEYSTDVHDARVDNPLILFRDTHKELSDENQRLARPQRFMFAGEHTPVPTTLFEGNPRWEELHNNWLKLNNHVQYLRDLRRLLMGRDTRVPTVVREHLPYADQLWPGGRRDVTPRTKSGVHNNVFQINPGDGEPEFTQSTRQGDYVPPNEWHRQLSSHLSGLETKAVHDSWKVLEAQEHEFGYTSEDHALSNDYESQGVPELNQVEQDVNRRVEEGGYAHYDTDQIDQARSMMGWLF